MFIKILAIAGIFLFIKISFMDTNVKTILENAGWYEGRQREIDYIIEEIKINNLPVPDKFVQEFLKEFINLELNFKTPDDKYGNIRLILEDIVPYIEERHLKVWSDLATEAIFPIGSLFANTAYLFLSHSGKFYMAYEDKFYLIGDDFNKCLDNIINQKDIHRIA